MSSGPAPARGPERQATNDRRSRAVHWREAMAVSAPIVIAVAIYLVSCFQLVETLRGEITSLRQVAWVLLCFVGVLCLYVLCVRRGFRGQSRGRLIWVIVSSYGALILTFAGLYYVLSAIGDYKEADEISVLYRRHLNAPKDDTEPEVKSRLDRAKYRAAFKGRSRSLWGGVPEPDVKPPGPADKPLRLADKPPDDITSDEYVSAFNVAPPAEPKPEFRPGNRRLVFLDCLHFSIVTVSTTGYGDVTPRQWYATLAADLEVLAGLAILIFALGMLFGNWWRADDLETLREQLAFGEVGYGDPFWRELKPHSEIAAARSGAPVCPRCESRHTLPVAERFKRDPEPDRTAFADSNLTFAALMAASTYLVYWVLYPYLETATGEGWRDAIALLLVGPIAYALKLGLSRVAGATDANRATTRDARRQTMSARRDRCWSCETCHQFFMVDQPAAVTRG